MRDAQLYADGQSSGGKYKRPVNVGNCVLFKDGSEHSFGLVRRFVVDEEGKLYAKLQVLKSSDDIPIAFATSRYVGDYELLTTNGRAEVPVDRILSLVQVLDAPLWQIRFVDSPANPVEGVHFKVYRHYDINSQKISEVRRPFLPGTHPTPRVPLSVASNIIESQLHSIRMATWKRHNPRRSAPCY